MNSHQTAGAEALYEVEVTETFPTRIIEVCYLVVATGLDAAVAEVATILPALEPQQRRVTVREIDEPVLLYFDYREQHTSPIFPSSVPLPPAGPRLFLVTARGHNPSLGRRGTSFVSRCLTLATGLDDAVAQQSRAGEGVTKHFEVQEWPGRVYERERRLEDPEFVDLFIAGQAQTLLSDLATGRRQATRGQGGEYTDAKGTQLRVVKRLMEVAFVEATAEGELTVTDRGRRYLAHLATKAAWEERGSD